MDNSDHFSVWDKEFPLVRRLRAAQKGPVPFLLMIFSSLHSLAHTLVRLLTLFMMGVLLATALKQMGAELGGENPFRLGLDQTLRMESWKAFRNGAYAFLIHELVFIAVPLLLFSVIGNQSHKAVHAVLTWVKTILLVTFSYALVGLFVDFLMLNLYMSVNVMGGSASELLPQFLRIFALL